MRIFFVGGIHGTGKSTLCKAVAAELPAEHLSAGRLARAAGSLESTTKFVADVAANQRRLLDAISERRTRLGDVILDGHFCVINKSREIERIPVQVFASIDPAALVHVSGDSDVICTRLSDRDGVDYDRGFIETFGQVEATHASEVARSLRRPILNVDGSTPASRVAEFFRRAQ